MTRSKTRTGAILDIEEGWIPRPNGAGGGSTRVNLQLNPGALCLVQLIQSVEDPAFFDAASGLLSMERGRVLFLGRCWELLKPDEANALRGLIGRVFAEARWIHHLSVADNLMLSQNQHSRATHREIFQECHDRTRFFGLPGIPVGRPAQTLPMDLVRAGCARAFMGNPYLVLIEDLQPGLLSAVFPALINAIREVRSRGGAVLWMTTSSEVWKEPSLEPDLRMHMAWNEIKEVA